MSNRPLVGQSELMYSQECDESNISTLQAQVDNFLAGIVTQNVRAAIEPEVQLLCRAMYHGFTTAAGRITIGEEYADIFPVLLQNAAQGSESSVLVARLLNGWPRVAAVAARAVLPWLQARWVIIEAKHFLFALSTIRVIVFCAKNHRVQAAAALRFSRDLAAPTAVRSFLQVALRVAAAAKRCGPVLLQLHLLLFYLVGEYFLFSNRVLGIRYVKRTPRHLSFPLFPLRIVGVLQLLRVVIIGIKQLARAIAQRQASSTHANVQFTYGVALDAAAADAAAEQDTEDVDGAAGDAPACPLCLCSRKQLGVALANRAPHKVAGCVHFMWTCVLLEMYCRMAGEEARVPALQEFL